LVKASAELRNLRERLLIHLFSFILFAPAPTLYTPLPPHPAFPFCPPQDAPRRKAPQDGRGETAADDYRRYARHSRGQRRSAGRRSEEHTSELQSRENLVCRLLLEKKKQLPP